MTLLRSILVLVHLVGFAMLLGGFLAQFVAGRYELSVIMRIGLGAAIGSGLLLAIPFPDDIELNHAKLAVKLGIAVLIAALFGVYSVTTRRGGAGNRTQFAAIGVLAFTNAAVAALWT
ncbi:hypothetical protein [Virgisporangium aurantiacum]|uniref:Fe-S protein n=1 Tax=Virgisporangium aurantiacum TaxID=175570 RepID=A0A8J3Z8U3_9ACTN|nr:hypothetical protein [Virgisporangium aurantiacum]GIJ59192.1 hypothetical protein Vau01_067080 [Virgisporangium aurantiacum]